MARSKLDKYADWMMLQFNKDSRTVSQELKEKYGEDVSYVSITRWRKKQLSPGSTQIRAIAIARVTKEVLEGEWIRNLTNIREGYERAKSAEDEDGMQRWTALGQNQVAMLLRTGGAQQVLTVEVDESGSAVSATEAFDKWLKAIPKRMVQ